MVLSSSTITEKFYNESGIVHQYTIPHNPQQNGRVERLNGTLVSLGNALLADAKLNHKFWEDAVATANYIHNRVPHKGINNKVPYEILTGNKVDYNKFKVFGCQVYYYIPKQFRKKIRKHITPRNISDMMKRTPRHIKFLTQHPTNQYYQGQQCFSKMNLEIPTPLLHYLNF